jgi:hypothetical protein
MYKSSLLVKVQMQKAQKLQLFTISIKAESICKTF